MKNLGRLIAKTNIGKHKRGFKPPMRSESFLSKMFQDGGKKASYNLRADDQTIIDISGSSEEDDPPPGGGDSIDWVVEPSLYTSDDKDDETRYLPEEGEEATDPEESELDYQAMLPYQREPDVTAVSAEEEPDEIVLVYEMAMKMRNTIHYRRIELQTAAYNEDPFRSKTAYLGISQEMDNLAKNITEVEGL